MGEGDILTLALGTRGRTLFCKSGPEDLGARWLVLLCLLPSMHFLAQAPIVLISSRSHFFCSIPGRKSTPVRAQISLLDTEAKVNVERFRGLSSFPRAPPPRHPSTLTPAHATWLPQAPWLSFPLSIVLFTVAWRNLILHYTFSFCRTWLTSVFGKTLPPSPSPPPHLPVTFSQAFSGIYNISQKYPVL